MNSKIYDVYISKNIWSSLLNQLFPQPTKPKQPENSTRPSSRASVSIKQSVDLNESQVSISEKRTPKLLRLKQETLQGALFSADALVLQPLQSPRTFLVGKFPYSEQVRFFFC